MSAGVSNNYGPGVSQAGSGPAKSGWLSGALSGVGEFFKTNSKEITQGITQNIPNIMGSLFNNVGTVPNTSGGLFNTPPVTPTPTVPHVSQGQGMNSPGPIVIVPPAASSSSPVGNYAAGSGTNTLLYVGIGIAVVLVVGVAAWFMMKK